MADKKAHPFRVLTLDAHELNIIKNALGCYNAHSVLSDEQPVVTDLLDRVRLLKESLQ
jgi:hypothetical protein